MPTTMPDVMIANGPVPPGPQTKHTHTHTHTARSHASARPGRPEHQQESRQLRSPVLARTQASRRLAKILKLLMLELPATRSASCVLPNTADVGPAEAWSRTPGILLSMKQGIPRQLYPECNAVALSVGFTAASASNNQGWCCRECLCQSPLDHCHCQKALGITHRFVVVSTFNLCATHEFQ